MAGRETASKNSVAIALVAIAFFLANLISRFPGLPNFDSDLQYAQAVSGHFTDWQPPIMAWLWSGLRLVVDGSGLLFALHVVCYWLGFGLIAMALSQSGHKRAAWAIIAVAILPTILLLNIQITKDVGLAVTLLSSFAIFFWYRSQNLKINPIAAGVALVFLLYGGLVRANAVFAIPPLLIYIFCPFLAARPVRFLLAFLSLAVLAIPISAIINHRILNAENSHPLRQLQVFDVAGIANNSGDISVFSDNRITLQDIADCYSPRLRDTLDAGGKCHVSLDPDRQDPTRTWLLAIAKHPLAYLKHRAAHFNEELSATFPRHHPEDAKYNWMIYVDVKPVALKEKLIDYVRKSPALLPWFSLVLGFTVLILSAQKRPSEPTFNIAAFCLAASGLFYMCAYLVVGVASDYRYQYWDIIAIMCASVICVAARKDVVFPLSRVGKAVIGVLALAVVSIHIAQEVKRDASPSVAEKSRDELTKQQFLTDPKRN
jgi:hypothetical protein